MSIDLATVDELCRKLDAVDYLADQGLATALFCAARLPQPLLLEGEAGVGKTEAAKALAAAIGTPLVRLQCYEGIDAAEALYEWNYSRQLLGIRAAEASGKPLDSDDLFTAEYLVARPLLKAIEHQGPYPVVLLIDEVDRSDDEFEAFLLELLADYQVTIPELGTIKAEVPPVTILTSNRTREVHDAVRRRCFYHWVDYPSSEREKQILALKVPEAPAELNRQIVGFIQSLRQMDLYKNPGIAESINWAQALTSLNAVALDPHKVDSTLGTLLKYQDDISRIQGSEAARLLAKVKSEAGTVAGG